MSSRRIAMLLSNDFSSDPRVEKEALALADDGWQVTVIAWGRSGRLPEREGRARYDVIRTGPRAPYGSGLRSVTLFRRFWQDAAAQARELAPAAVHCHDLDTAPAGLAAVRGVPSAKLVLDLHEMYRESRMVPTGAVTGPLARIAVDAIERRALARADLLVLAAPAFEDRYRGFSPRVIVENAPDAEMFVPVEHDSDGLRVCYAGQKRYAASLEALIDAVGADERLSAVIAGGGVAEAEIDRYASGRSRIEVTGQFAYGELPGIYARCDAVFAVYDSAVGNIGLTIPVKALEGMASGLPVIVNEGTWFGRFVVANRAGVAVARGDDAGAIGAALRLLADDPEGARRMGRNGRALIESGLNWHDASMRLVSAYCAL